MYWNYWLHTLFQSTLSARRATPKLLLLMSLLSMYFNPRSPRGERHRLYSLFQTIAIKFQSTLSARRATIYLYIAVLFIVISIHALREESDISLLLPGVMMSISIHALREESDCISTISKPFSENFNPRSPRGERPFS